MFLSKLQSWKTFKKRSRKKTPCLKMKLRRDLDLEFLEDRSLPSVTVGVSVNGIDGNHSSCGCLPPDGAEAPGPFNTIQAVNTALEITDKSGSVISGPTPLSTFFSGHGFGINAQSDPVVLFDESVTNSSGPNGRFIVLILDFTSTSSPDHLDIAISNDADATHGFTNFRQIAVGEGSFFADQPRLGINADAYFVEFNMFSTSTGAYAHPQILTIQKSTFITGGLTTFHHDMASNLFSVDPADMHGAVTGGPEYYVTEGAVQNQIAVITETNVLSNTPTDSTTNIGVTSYSQPPAAPQPSGTVTTNDSRMMNAVWRNNILVSTHTVGTGSPLEAHARWYQFSTSGSTPTLTMSGEVNPGSGIATYFPSVDIDSNNDIGMTYIESSHTEFVSMYVTGRTPSDPTGTMETGVRTRAGTTNYTGSRMGDYSGIGVDPSSTTTFWAENEFINNSGAGSWATGIASWSVSPPTDHLSITAPSSSTAGNAFSITVTAFTPSNTVDTNYRGTIHFTFTGAGGVPMDYMFTATDAGMHTFTNGVTLNTAGSQTVTATDTAGSGGATAGSAMVTVNPGTATQVVFGQQPTNAGVNNSISPAVTVKIEDTFNNVETGDNTDQVSMAIGTNPGGGTLSGTNPVTVSAGVATFGNLSINQPGTGYTLVASSGSLTQATSSAFNVTNTVTTTIEGFESGNINAYTKVPTGGKTTFHVNSTAAHDGSFGLQDAPGTDWIFRNDSTVQVTQGETIAAWLQFSTAADGQANFGFGATSTGTLSIMASPASGVLQLQLNSGFTGTPTVLGSVSQTYAANHWYRLEVDWGSGGSITGKLLDSDGVTVLNTVTGTSTAITSGGIAFHATGTNSKFWDTVQTTVVPAGVTHFSISPSTTTTTAGTSFSITVTALDASNHVVTGYMGTVHFTSSDGQATSGNGLPSDYMFTATDAGVHTFTSGVTLKTAGNQTVSVNDTVNTGLTGTTNPAIAVSPNTATQVVFGQQPSNTNVNASITPAVTVKVEDAFGNVETGDNTDQVTLAIGANPGGGTLSGTNPVTVSGGVATFSNLAINAVGNGYTLVASSGTLTQATSTAFNITPAGPTTIEGFESGNLTAYTVAPTGVKSTFQASSTAAHDGSFGLLGKPGNDWIFRNDSTAHVQQGDELTVWFQFSTAADGQANFGFGASSTGTLSIMASPASGVLQLQLISGYTGSPTVLGSVSQTYLANHWYRFEIDWGSTGSITGKLLDSDGTTVLNTVTGSSTAITSGGIAFHVLGTNSKFFDTVQRTPGVFVAKPPGVPVRLAAALSYEMKLQHAGEQTHAFGPEDGDGGGDMGTASVGTLNRSGVDQFFAAKNSGSEHSSNQLFQILGTL
jgi:hypothetical protein